MLSSALGALGRRSGGLLRLASAALPAAPLRLVVPAVAQRFSLACWKPGTHRARALGPSGRRRRSGLQSTSCRSSQRGDVAAVLLPDATGCMGKKKKKDTDEADDMYEVDFIDLAKMARQYLGRPASSAGVERLFSKAGKLYGDDKTAQDYTSLEHALFACAKTE